MGSELSIRIDRLFLPQQVRMPPLPYPTAAIQALDDPKAARPKLSHPDAQAAPSRGNSEMRDDWSAVRAEVEARSNLVQLPVAPATGSPRENFFMLDRIVNAVAEPGSKGCRKVMHRIDRALGQPAVGRWASSVAADDRARALIRARCRLCPSKCREPVL